MIITVAQPFLPALFLPAPFGLSDVETRAGPCRESLRRPSDHPDRIKNVAMRIPTPQI